MTSDSSDDEDDLITSTSKAVNESPAYVQCLSWKEAHLQHLNVVFMPIQERLLSFEVDNNIKTFVMAKSRRRKSEIFYMDTNCKFQSSFHIRRKWAERLFHYGFTANLLVCVCL